MVGENFFDIDVRIIIEKQECMGHSVAAVLYKMMYVPEVPDAILFGQNRAEFNVNMTYWAEEDENFICYLDSITVKNDGELKEEIKFLESLGFKDDNRRI